MSTHSFGHQSSGFGFATSLLGKPKHMGGFEEEWRRPTSNLGKMKSFSLQISNKTLSKLERKISKKKWHWRIFRRSKSMLPNDSATRPSSVSSPFHSCLQHLHVLDHWTGFTYCNKGRSLSFRRIAKDAWRCSGFSFFILFSLFCVYVSMLSLKLQIPAT
ncbi:hypothetical protein H5410_061770 [Solanum commersonii]|uniref:Uncharacterized protein n=1 Tax=Solanum commersonii TaxID=4109 RepID=A0A9J5W9T0_SOLCO|nr:hypothetical protein H5410_061770 [Solanum commersonii]